VELQATRKVDTNGDRLSRGDRVRQVETQATGRIRSLLLTTRTRSVLSNRFVLVSWDTGETVNALPGDLILVR
jgi:hypothetical protein